MLAGLLGLRSSCARQVSSNLGHSGLHTFDKCNGLLHFTVCNSTDCMLMRQDWVAPIQHKNGVSRVLALHLLFNANWANGKHRSQSVWWGAT